MIVEARSMKVPLQRRVAKSEKDWLLLQMKLQPGLELRQALPAVPLTKAASSMSPGPRVSQLERQRAPDAQRASNPRGQEDGFLKSVLPFFFCGRDA